MKKILLTIGAGALVALQAHATLVFDEPFNYTDGSITANSGGLWTNHSGSTLQVDVTSGVVNLTQAESEDVSAGIPGGPYTTGNLYASFTVNFSVLPLGGGTYFWHYKDTGNNFRARLWASTNGAAPGLFRVGIAATSGTPEFVPVDLSLGAEYKLVVRYDNVAATATLWINPTSEAAVTSRADSSDTATAITLHNVALRQSTSGGSGMGVLQLDNLKIGTDFADVQTIGGPPSISGLVDVSIPGDSNTGPLPFLVSDVETPAASLAVAATSSNPTLVPNNPANLTFGGAGENRTLTVTPAAGQQGTSIIEVVVTDGNSDTATNNFTITVGLPTISSVANQIAPAASVTGPLTVTVGDGETAPGSLTVTASSSNPSVLPDENISIQVSGATRTLYLTNIASGVATVTVNVNDGVFNVPTTFILTSYPDNGLLISEDFSYPDGSITANSGGLWTTHSASTGQTGQTQVVNGKLYLTNNSSEDINRWFNIAPINDTGGQLVFTRLVIDLSALPTAGGSGEYFTHIYAFGGAYRARVFTTTNGAAAGKYRLAISSSSFTPTVFPQDLSLNSSNVVIYRYNTATAEAKLWVNAASESSTSVDATDSSSTVASAYGIAIRQSTGIGSMSIDDLVVGSTFNQVWLAPPPATVDPIPLGFSQSGSDITLTWSDPIFNLQAAPAVTGTYTNVPGATSPYTTTMTEDQLYFRLEAPIP